ncbi:hypothetical protein BJF79_13615 [Actinomadura sp. CNU-125]|uniref:hypothetical protein n=1 Tax=Actinomadura sp. CNU-125 TaxID=1904961 RepID=UPI000958F787|nr:hypothetical protein [Actinomadura sp. CNU-125]OLT24375.1 hypothetical protein BJF79_13615 [Actinomadura sp. CNU-125]
MAPTLDHIPQLAPGVPAAPVIDIYCWSCGDPRTFEDRHTDQVGASPLDTCTRCDLVVHMVCTDCGAKYRPQSQIRTPSWLR